MTDTFRALCAELVDEAIYLGSLPYEQDPEPDLIVRTRAALAQSEPQVPSDEAIMQLACISLGYEYTPSLLSSPENGIGALEALPSELLAFARAVLALAQPEPQGVTDEEIDDLASELLDGDRASTRDFARAVLARWGRPAIEPVPVSERLPGPEDCDAEGRCWWWRTDGVEEHWELISLRDPIGHNESCASHVNYTHSLPHYALPVSQQQQEVQ